MGGVLVPLDGLLSVHCLRVARGPCCCHCQGSRSTDCKENPHSASYDSDQLVHVSNCLLVSNVRIFRSQSSCVHPGRVLCFRHHLQVRSWLGYLPDLVRQVWKEGSLTVSVQRSYVW